jgi:ubiquinone/menaquinone biosynthesis C-methylase UbiE
MAASTSPICPAMGELRILAALVRGMPRRGTHQERLEGFYGPQADGYDAFRERLLPGRSELMRALPLPPGAVLAEFGGGTGRNLEALGPRLATCRRAVVVDLCRPLLAEAERRAARLGWTNVETAAADACTWDAGEPLDAAVFSFSLTMIPDWRAALANACRQLRPGGVLAVADFHLPRDASWLTRAFWPRWFAHDGVRPSAEHLPWITDRCTTLDFSAGSVRLPWLCGLRAPVYRCIGRVG